MSLSSASVTWCKHFIAALEYEVMQLYSMAQALGLVSDLKLGLYCKIKPKAMFLCQSYGTALGAVVNYSAQSIKDQRMSADC